MGGDLNYPEVKGKRTILTRLLNWYIGKLHKAAHYDADVSIAFLKVINMVSSPPSLLAPRIIWRIVKNNIKYNKMETNKSVFREAGSFQI